MRPVVVGLDHDSYGFHAVLFGDSAPQRWYSFRATSAHADVRRIEAFREAQAFFDALPKGAHVFAEEPLIMAKNGKTTRLLSLMAGAIWASHVDCYLYWHWVDVAHWKKEIIGKGNVNKAQIAEWVKSTASEWLDGEERMEVYGAYPDLFDAHCLAVYGNLTVPGLRVVA